MDEIYSAAIFIILIGIFFIPIAFLSFRCLISQNISFLEQGLKVKESSEEVMLSKILVWEFSCKVDIVTRVPKGRVPMRSTGLVEQPSELLSL